MSQIDFADHSEGRYDRHELISWWDQPRLARARVIVAGAGALGNEVLKLLALIGVGQITVIDFDVIARSNLTRTILFRESDVGRPKALVAAKRVREINPDVEIEPVQGDLRFALGLGDYRAADLVLGCLDSVNARWALNRKCMQSGVEWIDGGISDFHGLVARYGPTYGGCYECNFTPRTVERFNRRYSCPFGLVSSQADEKVPTTAITTSAIAAIQVQQALMMLHGLDDGLQPGERLTVYLKPYHMVKDRLPVNPDCLAHATLPAQIPVIGSSDTMTTEQAVKCARDIYPEVSQLSLPAELVVQFECSACGGQQPVMRFKEQVRHEDAICPRCGVLRTPRLASTIAPGSPLWKLTLVELGLPKREILAFEGGECRYYIQVGS